MIVLALTDWIAIYGALLSIIIAVVAAIKFSVQKIRAWREQAGAFKRVVGSMNGSSSVHRLFFLCASSAT